MKKIILLTIALGFSFYGFSQGTKYGVRIGLNISNLDFDGVPIDRNLHRNGFVIGFFGEFEFTKTFSVMPELQFSAEGAKLDALRLEYLQVPILLKFRLSEKFNIGFGPQVGLKIYEHEDGIKNFAFSGVGGLEFKLTHVLFLDARYTYGFTNIFDENLISADAKNTNIQLGFGYKF